ncbi:MAG TPA: hypothetical protein VKA38_14110 [Draconibacterium sp.]|nr:hypothetical protein [Draconibacterium sp.]
MNTVLLYIASALSFIWGIAHLIPTKNVVKNFGEISKDNRRIITMEWINEGATLIFVGILTGVVTCIDPDMWLAKIIYLLVALFLIILAFISLFTGFRVHFLPFKLCPFIFGISALLIVLAIFL